MTDPFTRTPYDSLYGVYDDDITQGMTAYLMEQPDLLSIVGKEPGTNIPFIFQNTLLKNMEGTQSNAIVVRYSGDWAAPTRTGFECARMSVRIYCDALQDADGNTGIDDPEPRLRLNKIFRRIDAHLNRPVGSFWMGDVLTIDHTRLGSMAVEFEPESPRTIRGEVFYGVTIIGYR